MLMDGLQAVPSIPQLPSRRCEMESKNSATWLMRKAELSECDYAFFSPNALVDSHQRLTQTLGYLLEEVSHG
jgi:hypothetical protein